MNRRQLLAGTGALIAGVVAGCNSQAEPPTMLGADTGLSVQNTRVIDDREEFVTDTDYPQDRNDGPPEVAFEAELTQPTDSPPEIEFRLTNTGPQRKFFMGMYYPFTTLGSESRELVLLPSFRPEHRQRTERDQPSFGLENPDPSAKGYCCTKDELIPDSNNGGCWQTIGRPIIPHYGVAPTVTHSETLSNQSTILLAPDAPCPPAETQLLSNVLSIGGIRANQTELVVELRVTR